MCLILGHSWVGAEPLAITARETSIPAGWLGFCERNPDECTSGPRSVKKIEINKSTQALINKINLSMNKKINAITDKDHWHKEDYWSLPDANDPRGDCEDYALLKRKLLIERGIPASALLLAMVRFKSASGEHENGEKHLVLVARTENGGDLILDNLRDSVLPSDHPAVQADYQFLKIQADYDEDVWLDIERAPVSSNAREAPDSQAGSSSEGETSR